MQRVFISSTSRDLENHRAAVRDAILGLGMHPVMMEHFPAMDADAIADRTQAQQVARVYDAMMVVYGRVSPGGVRARYEIAPCNEDGSRWLELTCDGGAGWIDEQTLPGGD